MAKSTKKRAIIYSNVKENKKLEEEKKRLKESQINLNDEVIIGFNNSGKINTKNIDSSQKKKNKDIAKKIEQKNKKSRAVVPQKQQTRKVPQKQQTRKVPQNNPNINQQRRSVKQQNVQKKQQAVPKQERKPMNPQKKKIISLVVKLFIVIALLICVAVFLFNCEIFNIKEIVVSIENNNVVTESQIIEASNIQIGQNLFGISKHKAKELIEKNNYIDSVKIRRELPNKIIIDAVERKIRFQLEKADSENKYIYVDNKGVIVDSGTEKKDCVCIVGDKVTEYSYGEKVSDNDLEALSAVIQIQQEADIYGLSDKITKIDISNHNDYVIYFESLGKSAHIGDVSLINDKMARIKKILDIESDYEGVIYVNVDLNNGEYPYFRENV